MTRHKHHMIAVKATTVRGKMRISAMTQSPRGTKVPYETVEVDIEGLDHAARERVIKAAIDELYAKEPLPI